MTMAPLLAHAYDWIRMYVCVPTIDTELSLTRSSNNPYSQAALRPDTHTLTQST